MKKTKIVAIGYDIVPQKLMRLCEGKLDFENQSHVSGATFIDDLSKKTDEQVISKYKYLESTILNDNYLFIISFNSYEDFERFDINGVLKEKAIIVDSMSEEEYGMTIWELSTYVNKSKNHNRENSKVILYDKETGKEYMMGDFEPRKIHWKEYDETVEFSIYPVKKEKIKDTPKIKVSEFIKQFMDKYSIDINFLSKETGIPASSLYGKFTRDSFTAYDLLKISKSYGMNFEELMDMVDLD